jgi:hypothetical protein
MPGSRVVLWPKDPRPTVNKQSLPLAAIIIVACITAHFTRMHVCKLRVLLLEILDPRIIDGRDPTVLTPTNRILKTAPGTSLHA